MCDRVAGASCNGVRVWGRCWCRCRCGVVCRRAHRGCPRCGPFAAKACEALGCRGAAAHHHPRGRRRKRPQASHLSRRRCGCQRARPRARSRVRRRGCWCVRERVCGGHTALRWEFAAAGWANAVLVWVWVHTEGCTAAPRCTSPAGAQWPWRRCADGRHALTTGCSRDGGVRHRQGANGEVVPSQPPRQLPACLHNRWYQRGCDDGHFYVGYVCDARVPLSFHAAAWYLTCVLHTHRHSHCRRSEWPSRVCDCAGL